LSKLGLGQRRSPITVVEGRFDRAGLTTVSTTYTTAGPIILTATLGESLTTYTVHAAAGAIQVRYHSSDASILGLSPGTVPVTDPATPGAPVEPNTGLPVAAKAGIGVAAALGALVLLGIVVFILTRRRRHRRQQEVQATSASKRDGVHEKDGDGVYEKDGEPVEGGQPGGMLQAAQELDAAETTALPAAHELTDSQPLRKEAGAAGTPVWLEAYEPSAAGVRPGGEMPSASAPEPVAPAASLTNFVPPAASSSHEVPPTGTAADSDPPAVASSSHPDGDPQLQFLLDEYNRVRAEKERLQQLGELERREVDLRRAIQEMLSKEGK